MTFRFFDFLSSNECEDRVKASGLTVVTKTELDDTVSCVIDDDQHEQVIELANTRGYQVAYDVELAAENERILFERDTSYPTWSQADTSLRCTGRIDTPRKAQSLKYDDHGEKRSERFTIKRRSNIPGNEQIRGETRYGAAEGSENNSDPNDSGRLRINQELDVES